MSVSQISPLNSSSLHNSSSGCPRGTPVPAPSLLSWVTRPLSSLPLPLYHLTHPEDCSLFQDALLTQLHHHLLNSPPFIFFCSSDTSSKKLSLACPPQPGLSQTYSCRPVSLQVYRSLRLCAQVPASVAASLNEAPSARAA